MNEREAFKFGFHMQCARRGLSELEAHQCLMKLAQNPYGLGDIIKDIASPVKEIAATGVKTLEPAVNKALWALILAPGVIGPVAGYALAKATAPQVTDTEQEWEEEAADYLRATEYLEQARRQRRQVA